MTRGTAGATALSLSTALSTALSTSLSVAMSASPCAAQAVIEVSLAPRVADALVDELRACLGDDVEVRASTDAAAVAPGTVVVAAEYHLRRLARHRDFAPLRAASEVDGVRRDTQGRWLLPWSLRYAVVATGIEAAGLTSYEALALAGPLHDRLLLCSPDVDAGPWLLGMQECLLRGQQEAAGFGLWTALDARVARYSRDDGELLASLASSLEAGQAQAAVVPRVLLRRPGVPPRLAVTDFASDAGVPIGVAVAAPAAEGALAVARRLAESDLRHRIAEALDLSLGSPRDPRFPDSAVDAWLEHHAQRIAGQGRRVEGIADALDWAVSLVFVAVIVVIWRRQRRSAA